MDQELDKLYEWLMSEEREPARTHFTAGKVRNIAKEFEFQLKQARYFSTALGDTIEWDLDFDYGCYPKGYKFQAEVVGIDWEDECYCVYAVYGQDKIPFDKCKIIKRK